MDVFVEPARGMVDFVAFRDLLHEIGWQGFGIVEQDMFPAPFDKPLPIARRTRAMLDSGALEEVAALAKVSANLEKAIGFREIRALLAGETDRATCEELINAATRQYAKRQETWFRREKWLAPKVVTD